MDAAVEAAVAGGVEQVVAVAAGYDTRSLRFGARAAAAQGLGVALSFFEVDLPAASK